MVTLAKGLRIGKGFRLNVWPGGVANPALWLRSDDVNLTGSLVDQWNDRSGNGHHATASGAQRPTWNSSDAVFGHASVEFDGANTYMTIPDTTDLELAGDIEILTVSVATTAAGSQTILSKWNSSSGDREYFLNVAPNATDTGATRFAVRDSGNSTNQTVDCAVIVEGDVSNPHIQHVRYDDAGDIIGTRTDAHPTGITAAATSHRTGSEPVTIGATADGTNILDGKIVEVIVFNRLLSEAERTAVTDYLVDRYSVSRDPLPYTTNLKGHWRFDRLVTIATGISDLEGASGTTHDFAQGTAAAQPTHVLNSALGGRPAGSFDGTNDRMTTADHADFQLPNQTVIIAYKSGGTGLTSRALLAKWLNPDREWAVTAAGSTADTPDYRIRNSADTSAHILEWSATVDSTDGVVILVCRSDADDMGINVNDATEETQACTTRSDTASVVLGALDDVTPTWPVNALIGEVIYFGEKVSDANLTTLSDYLEHRYSVAT